MFTKEGMGWKTAFATLAAVVVIGCNGGENKTAETTPSGTGSGGGSTPTASGGTRPEVTGEGVKIGDTIKIGVVGSLTGDQKAWGDDEFAGAKMAIEEANAAGGIDGKKIEMLSGDSASSAEPAKSATEKLLSDGVVAIVG
ncbi:amino acid ABC transporter substrate-binding protein, partial [bacterium]